MTMNKLIRNFSIIAHIDHGKSTLADRLLEYTETIKQRQMKEQVLDSMDLERERGITIKMQPVRMNYFYSNDNYQLNLIDTPGHIDFSYEVSRALKAVEGVILLIDSTQGVQAQTLSVLDMAQKENLIIIPVLNKIDLPSARLDDVKQEVVELLGCSYDEILSVSGKTGQGVPELLSEIINRIPPPVGNNDSQRGLVFDFEYSTHRGVIVYLRMFDGSLKQGDQVTFIGSGENFSVIEVGVFRPNKEATDKLDQGQIGYIVTGLKKPGKTKVGDTLTGKNNQGLPIAGYQSPKPVVWASVYPETQDDFVLLKQALERLSLSDSSISFEEESSGALGRGFRCGFLGMLHLEIITERIKREFTLEIIIATPTISYRLVNKKDNKELMVYSPHLFPQETKDWDIYESWAKANIIIPTDYLNSMMQIVYDHEGLVINMDTFGDKRISLEIEIPLRELMRNFFDEVKSATSGFGSLSYSMIEPRLADVVRLDLLVNSEPIHAFSKIVSKKRVQKEADESVEKLKNLLPRQMISVKVQASAMGRILAARSISALRKDVTDYLYGGDITRKMKLREKQKKGKKKMQQLGKVNIPHDVFLKMMKSE